MGRSIEKICRRLPQAACDEGIVIFNVHNYGSTRSPGELTGGDLAGLANLLGDLLAERRSYEIE